MCNLVGETGLYKLLTSMSPVLRPDEYVFCTMGHAPYGDYEELRPLASFIEDEGLTLVVPRVIADAHDMRYESVFKCITLSVHSRLDAVGLTAAVSTKLTKHGISANFIAAFYHDHVFVQAAEAKRAMEALSEFSCKGSRKNL